MYSIRLIPLYTAQLEISFGTYPNINHLLKWCLGNKIEFDQINSNAELNHVYNYEFPEAPQIRLSQ